MYVHLTLAVISVYPCVALDHPLIELSGAVCQIYKCPEDNRYEDLLEASRDFVNFLIEIKQEAKNDNIESLTVLKEVYLEGNPPFHLRNIPWGKLIAAFHWSDIQINEYLNVVLDTRSVWNECLHILEKHKASDEIL